jgi:uncharacterized protein YecT (DUF1311 family)
MRTTVALLVSLLGFAYTALAQSAKTPEKQCGDYDTQSEMNDCAAREAGKADAALNSTYQELMGKIRSNKTAIAKLIAAEKAWVAFRDAELAAEWPVADGENPNVLYGSVHPFCYYNELTAMTLDREKTLKELMSHEEGDLCASGIGSTQNQQGATRNCGADATKHKPTSAVKAGAA